MILTQWLEYLASVRIPFCFNIRMVSYAMFWAVLVLVPVGVNMVLKLLGTDKKTRIGLAIGILAYGESSTGLVEGPVVG